ncbi:unnamed protein product [Peniophora sp. CBMAI 1063]|nr:unnamed protein product [Peniophora sp. CBMAI 1063]
MAPSTRSSGKAVAKQTKKRSAEDSDTGDFEYDSSDEEGAKKKGAARKPPAKRAKTTKSTKGGKKRCGKLGALPVMPLDILEEIFSLLNWTDLFSISRTTKAFRSLLLKDAQFRPLWAQAWLRVEGYPACPEDVQLYKWLHLLFGGSYCHTCSASSVHRIYFSIQARVCVSCVKANMLPHGSEYLRIYVSGSGGSTERRVCELIPAVTLPPNRGRADHRYVFPADYTTLKKKIEEIDERFKFQNYNEGQIQKSEYIRARYSEYLPRFQYAQECEQWQGDRLEQRADNVEERRSKRRAEISKRLKQLDYTDDDIAPVWKLKDVNVAKPLTERAWNSLFLTLQPTLDDGRSTRLKREHDARHDSRADAAREAWFALMQSLSIHPRDLPYLPIPDQCVSLEPISRLVDEDVEVSEEWLERLRAACPEALDVARNIWAERRLTAATMIVKQDTAFKDALESGELDLTHILSRATSVFRVCGGDNRDRFGFEALSHAREHIQHTDLTDNYDNERIWDRDRIKVLEHGRGAVGAVLKHLGLGLETTIRELDRLEPIFICLSCPAQKRKWLIDDFLGRAALGWRDMVRHLCNGHEKGVPDVRMRLLTVAEMAEMAAVILPTGEKFQPPSYVYGGNGICWGCCHCTESMKARNPRSSTINHLMRRAALDEHLRTSHQITSPQEDLDYYWHPSFCRVGLLKGYGSGYKVPFDEDSATSEA